MKQNQLPFKNSRSGPTPKRRLLFFTIMLLIPFAMFAMTETILRFLEYGGNLDLVVKAKIGGREFYQINRAVGRRYFKNAVSTIPEPTEDIFEIVKGKNTIRIFCLGESTMAGFPYEFNATVPSLLRDRLTSLLPHHHVEVVNVGLSAVGTFVVEDFMNELADYEPDLYVVYVGHNEFYGVYGVGSSIGIGGSPWSTRLHLSLLKFKTYTLLQDLIGSTVNSVSPPATPNPGTLMSQVVREQLIPYQSELYAHARGIYAENLGRLIASARAQNVPIVFSGLVSNIRHQRPFVSAFKEQISDDERAEYKRILDQGDNAFTSGDLVKAEQCAARALHIDSTYAASLHLLGLIRVGQQRFEEGRQLLVQAKDLDALRFRASTEFENDLRAVCAAHNVPIARVDSVFVSLSPHGLIGNELILEHLHPNIRGYFQMAKTIARTIQESGLLPFAGWNREHDVSDTEYWGLSRVSDFDSIAGSIKTHLLMQRWPFKESSNAVAFTPDGPKETLVYNYVQGQIPWSEARYKFAEYYAGRGGFDRARKECLAVAKVLFFSFQPLLKVADYYRMEGKNIEAAAAYSKCSDTEDNPFSRMKHAIILIEQENLKKAEEEIGRALAADRAGPYKLSREASASARYMLGVVYAKQGRYTDAQTALRDALTLQPGHAESAELLRDLSAIGP